MTTSELIGLMAPNTLREMIADIEDSAGDSDLLTVRQECYDALVAIVGEKDAGPLAQFTTKNGQVEFTDEEQEPEYTCHLCRKAKTTLDAAPEQGWFPHYYAGEMEVDELICPGCIKTRCHIEDHEICLNGTAEYNPMPF